MKADNELLNNLDKLHTTELGIKRIKKNRTLFLKIIIGKWGLLQQGQVT